MKKFNEFLNENLGITKDTIIKFYKKLCELEKIDPLLIKFERVGQAGAKVSYNPKTMKPSSMSIDMSKLMDIEYAIYHELAHQILLLKDNYPGHGKKFQKEFNRINDTYMYSKISKILYNK